MKILITKRESDYHACIEGDAARWGCGKSINCAIGDLVSAYSKKFGVEILIEGKRENHEGY